ncbi:signal peptidase I [Acidithiobacillus sulfuriphilus]|uniref:Signal peptidase I n=2 Tax=Acidithiobacillus sulfuriphilus TaxID=1867749 RepID=A0A3M8QPN5_9PROT|nr:signal peptidase I [Acidithiobacillus sulfuriphilus]RNF58229.1 signal peptidase I [Acidithiobacillus sulfuriphilus]
MNFTLLLFLAVVLTGLIWLVDLLALRRRRAAGQHESLVVDYARSFFPVLLIVFLIRAFLFEPFKIPSGSMIPTLRVGDFVLVNKYSLGLRLPLIHTQLTQGGPVRAGDVMVFRYPKDPREDYIKRVIGLPGDTIEVKGNDLYINGKLIPQKYVGPFTYHTHEGYAIPTQEYQQELGGHPFHIIEFDTPEAQMDFGPYKVPPHCYFMMGDDRDNSNDSRFWGCVPEQNIVGKAMFVWFSWDANDWSIRWNQIGRSLD